MDQQAKWATTLKKSQHQNKKRANLSLEQKQQEVKKRMQNQQKMLKETAEKKDLEGAKKIFNKLIELRAELVKIELEQMEKTAGKTLEEELIKQALEKYKQDCMQLALDLDKLFGIKNDL